MSETKYIFRELTLSFEGEPWHGPSLMDNLRDVDAPCAVARPIGNSHNIAELAKHLMAWERVIIRRIHGERVSLTPEQDFEPTATIQPEEWKKLLEKLEQTHSELLKTVSSLNEAKLTEIVPGKPYDLRHMLLGAAQHAAYHSGQIALLKKCQK
jgi:uncharacterized damage-inducible protein DinB